MRTCSKTQKYSIAHNFFSFDHNIGMLHVVSIVLMRGIQLKKNFSNWELPSSHNYSKWWEIICMLHLKILIFMSEIQLNNNFSNLSYPVLRKNFISYGGLWYNINCILEILQQIHQKALQIRQYKKKKQLCMKPPGFLVLSFEWNSIRLGGPAHGIVTKTVPGGGGGRGV